MRLVACRQCWEQMPEENRPPRLAITAPVPGEAPFSGEVARLMLSINGVRTRVTMALCEHVAVTGMGQP